MFPNGRNITTDGEEVVKVFNNQYVNNVEKSCRRKPDHIARDNNYEAIELFLPKTIQAFIKLKSTMLIIKLHFSLYL